MIDPALTPQEKKTIYQDLLKYCELDTLAMVEILKTLNNL